MLIFNHATMGAGKSAILIAKASLAREQCLIAKPSVDTRNGEDVVWSRNGQSIKCNLLIKEEENILKTIVPLITDKTKYIYIDEAQFLSSKQVEDLLFIAHYFNIVIETYGLLTNFKSELFEGSKRLIELADKNEFLVSYDSWGITARQNARLVNGEQVSEGSEIQIGLEEYVAMSNRQFFQENWKDKIKEITQT